MNKEKIKNVIAISIISLLVLGVVGVSYAYFRLQIEGSGNDIVLDTGDLRLRYTDGKEISLSNAMPGDSVSKTVTVENIGTRDVTYQLNWSDLINTIQNYELHVTMECKSYTGYGTSNQTESGECNRIYRAVPISDTSTSALIKNNISIKAGITHEYNITVTFDDKDYDQSSNMKKSFSGKVDISEYNAPKPVYCTYDGTPSNGDTYVNGIYTYTYSSSKSNWSVVLTDKTSTNPVTEAPCTYINDVPLKSLNSIFSNSKASLIDVSSFDTSNVENMGAMFWNNEATEIKGFENFDTSNVIDMHGMFYGSKATSLNLSSFDTSNVTDMSNMFYCCRFLSKIIGLENWNTHNVTTMKTMFQAVPLSSLDLSNWDTSNVTDMTSMFQDISLSSLDLSNWNTSKVTSMDRMFYSADIISLDLSNFDTSDVTDMAGMFASTKVTKLDLTSFDTSNVTYMNSMFEYCNNLTTIYVSVNFDTSNVTSDSNMFKNSTKLVGGSGTKYDSSHVDKEYARIDTAENPGYFTKK